MVFTRNPFNIKFYDTFTKNKDLKNIDIGSVFIHFESGYAYPSH